MRSTDRAVGSSELTIIWAEHRQGTANGETRIDWIELWSNANKSTQARWRAWRTLFAIAKFALHKLYKTLETRTLHGHFRFHPTFWSESAHSSPERQTFFNESRVAALVFEVQSLKSKFKSLKLTECDPVRLRLATAKLFTKGLT